MSKSILLIDTPKKCGDCKLFTNNGNCSWCVATKEEVSTNDLKPVQCPLISYEHQYYKFKVLHDAEHGKTKKWSSDKVVIFNRKWLIKHAKSEFEIYMKLKEKLYDK
jgi:hypothetical protein